MDATVLLIGLLVFIAAIMAMHVVLGYNLTKADIWEGKILVVCVETEIVIDYCNQIYGGKDYGDAIK